VDNAAVYDPGTNTWAAIAPLPTPRGGATAQAINGLVYVVGGMDGSGASLATLEIYDPATNSWTAGPDMAIRRDNPGSAALDGRLYLFGGRTRDATGTEVGPTLGSVEMFDPGTGTWEARATMPTGRRTMVVGTLNGRAQVMGGEKTPNGGTFEQNEEYDPVSDTWRALTDMATSRHGAVAGVINDVVYVVGGGPKGGTSFSDLNEAFSFEDGSNP
jgi:N-acetylneuraminic acid mutarotase